MQRLPLMQLWRHSNALFNGLGIHKIRVYHWGTYDVTPGQCCKMRDEETTKCYGEKIICKPAPLPNLCYTLESNATLAISDYPKQLLSVIRAPDPECDLIRHDVCFYKPSDKCRRFQRTWPECPFIWLRPKKTCCPDEECYLLSARRRRPPPQRQLTIAEKHAFHMKLLCATMRLGMKAKRKCIVERKHIDCTKVPTPFPSFSECEHKCIQCYCPIECSCRLKPSLCEMWRTHHRNGNLIKRCTQALVDYCPYKQRSRFLY